jgi:hypothetical protein
MVISLREVLENLYKLQLLLKGAQLTETKHL